MLPSARLGSAIRAVVVACALVLGLLLGTPTVAQAATKPPTGLSAGSYSNNAVRLTWKTVSKAAAYQVKYSTSSKFTHPKYVTTTAPVVEIGKLKASKTYYFKVKALKAGGKALTGYSKVKKVKTRSKKSYSALNPTGLKATVNRGDELTLTWRAQGSTNRYLIRWSTKKSMKSAKSKTVTGTTALVEGLKRATPYYFTVEVRSTKNTSVSQRSGVVKVTTAKKISFGTPSGLSVSRVNPTDFTVSWSPVRKATRYRVAYAAGTWAETDYLTTSSTSVKLGGLIANTAYLVKVQATDASGQPAGEFSTIAKAKTPAQNAALRVATYNVRAHNSSPESTYEQPWRIRRGRVADTILRADPDVVSLQEAQQSKLKDDSSVSQFEDLRDALNAKVSGTPWKVTNDNRYNCSNPNSNACEASDATEAEKAKAKNQGASNGTRIVYRTDRLKLLSQGSKELPKLHPTTDRVTGVKESYSRYVVWAFLQQKSTGKSFLFAAIHLEPGNDNESTACGTSANPLCTLNRQTQARAVLATLNSLNTDKLPIVLAGDVSSSRAEVGGNLPYQVFTDGGLVDPLGSTSYRAPATAPAESRINIAFNSVNKFEPKARRYASGESTYNPANNNRFNGAYNDYILLDKRVRIAEFEQVVQVDGNGYFVGVIPSDHNLLRATLWLP